MKNTIIVQVKRKDLRHPYGRPDSCPINQALRREFPDKHILVGQSDVRIDDLVYDIHGDADEKAFERAQSFIGWLKGGFTVLLTRRYV